MWVVEHYNNRADFSLSAGESAEPFYQEEESEILQWGGEGEEKRYCERKILSKGN